MMTMIQIKEVLTGKRPLVDVWHYLIGNFRYKLYYSKHFKSFIRSHIFEQIEHRVSWMDKECLDAGECRLCGCSTTQLQMSNKSCENPCYPEMMNRKTWKRFILHNEPVKDSHGWWIRDKVNQYKVRPTLILKNEKHRKKISSS